MPSMRSPHERWETVQYASPHMTEIAVSFDDFNLMDYVDNTDLYNQPFTCRWWYPSSIHGSSKWSAHILVSISSFELVGYLEIHGTGTSKWERPYLGSLSSFYLVGAYLILPSKIRGIEDMPASAIWLSRGVSAWFDARECFVLQDFCPCSGTLHSTCSFDRGYGTSSFGFQIQLESLPLAWFACPLSNRLEDGCWKSNRRCVWKEWD